MDYLELGSMPAEEECAQIGSHDYHARARAECRAYASQLMRQFGLPPGNARIQTKWFPHEFGSYAEVVCYYETEEEYRYALSIEHNSPARWDAEARKELGL